VGCLTTKMTEEMPITFDMESDVLYRQGKTKGIQKARLETAKNLIENTDFSDEKIAFLASLNVGIVKNMRAELMRQ
jgi:hypothetical protein